jgi:release factor glutamine methyltransferase
MAPSLGELLHWGKDSLKAAGIDDFEISAELLLRSLLCMERSQFLLSKKDTVDQGTCAKYQDLVVQRSLHVPLQYLTGWVEFYSLKLKIDGRALIPRPETEILVDTAIRKLIGISSPAILDIGTGSGNIAIAMAKNVPGSRVTANDVSGEALELARMNAELNGVTDNIRWIMGDIMNGKYARSLGLYDCVVSNPPYVSEKDKDKLQPEVVKFEPKAALFVGDDPLIFFKTIMSNIVYILKPGGLLAFEVGIGQALAVSDLMKADFRNIEVVKDLAGIDRVVIGIYAGTR